MKHALEIKNLTISYGFQDPVVDHVSVTIPRGVICAVVGPNGAGKTTLIKSILGLVKPVAGIITLFDVVYSEQKSKIAYVPQRTSVDWDFPVSVLDVVLMGRYPVLGWFKRPRYDDIQEAYTALRQVKLEQYAHRSIRELSGGERQRVFLARALVQNAQLYIMDEPFVGVDAVTERTIVDVLKQLRLQGKTIIIVHHDLQTLREYFDWMILLNVRLIDAGPLERVYTKNNIALAYGSLPYFLAVSEGQ